MSPTSACLGPSKPFPYSVPPLILPIASTCFHSDYSENGGIGVIRTPARRMTFQPIWNFVPPLVPHRYLPVSAHGEAARTNQLHRAPNKEGGDVGCAATSARVIQQAMRTT